MRKIKAGIVIMLVFAVALVAIFSGNVIAGDGPALNSGDGDPDGSGLYPVEPNGNGVFGDGYGEPAPSSGDGIPDGSGR